MEPGSPEWIEASIAQLEQLEQQRATHQQAIETVKEPMALRRHTEALGRLDAEIKALYAQLESFAEDDEEEEEKEEEPADDEWAAAVATPDRRTEGDETLSAPHKAAEPVASTPVAATLDASPPFASPPASMPAPSASYDDDEPKGGAGKWIFLGVLLVGGLGAGGFFMMQGQKKAGDQPAQNGSGEVIKAGEVPPDTEDLKAAKGADVDRTPLPNQGGGTGGSGGTGGGGSSKKDKKDDDKKVLKLDGGDDDPLG